MGNSGKAENGGFWTKREFKETAAGKAGILQKKSELKGGRPVARATVQEKCRKSGNFGNQKAGSVGGRRRRGAGKMRKTAKSAKIP